MSTRKKLLLCIIPLVIIVGGGSFYGGMQYQKKLMAKNLPSGVGNFGGMTPPSGSSREQNGGTPGNGRGSAVDGEIISKDDKSVTIKTSDGSTKTVYFSDSTTVSKNEQGSASDLAVGTKVMASGSSNSDGSVSAERIQIQPS